MLIQPDCIPCILKMAVSAMKQVELEDSVIRNIYPSIAEIPALKGQAWQVTSPLVIEQVLGILEEATGQRDPFQDLKQKQNEAILGLESFLKDLSREDPDPLCLGVKLAIIGNTIDLMMGDHRTDVENTILEQIRLPIPEKAFADLRRHLETARTILYLGDNAGEIVFDRFFIELLKERFSSEIFFVVKSVPAMNDATLRDASQAGLDGLVSVLENGMDGPFPGTDLSRCSPEVQELAQRADLIISKGGGNFDSLGEESRDITGKTFFMLLSKCVPYRELFNIPLFEPILSRLP
jgi:uncharacterized protein with ATP-grasp and redox domains